MADTVTTKSARIRSLEAVLTKKDQRESLRKAVEVAKGDVATAIRSLANELSTESYARVNLAQRLAEWSDDHVPLVKHLATRSEISNLRDVALRFDAQKIGDLVDTAELPSRFSGRSEQENKEAFSKNLYRKLFAAETSAVLQRMAESFELPIEDTEARDGVAKFLSNQPTFNIRATSIRTALASDEAFAGIAPEHRPAVIQHLETLQRVQGITPEPAAIPLLMKANLTSAFRVAELSQSTFMRAYGDKLGPDVARQIHSNAVQTRIRNEHALVTMREVARGTGLALLDGQDTFEVRRGKLRDVAMSKGVPLNLETLFGSLDYCECDDCLSVYSPAAYFVELLQYLRNNNLEHDKTNDGIENTPLEFLFRRRPDLGCLELTCENTFTVLPYVDLVNEVMESFVVHANKYLLDTQNPKQATLDTFNVEGETTGELLAEPQHTNYGAYCILKSAVFPFTLPYHQPLDATRILLEYLETSRFELVDTFRSASAEHCLNTPSADQTRELQDLHDLVLQRAADAEFLGLSQEEYIILTREAFWPKRYFELTQGATITDRVYRERIGVYPVCAYYGYDDDAAYGNEADHDNRCEMLNISEVDQLGLTFVKRQFLRRTGIAYPDLVELLKTRFVNPRLPEGSSLSLMEGIRHSYAYLNSLVNRIATTRKDRYAEVLKALESSAASAATESEAGCHCQSSTRPHSSSRTCEEREALRQWVYCYFERVGKLIVLDSGDGLRLPTFGTVRYGRDKNALLGELSSDGTLVDPNGVAYRATIVVDGDSLVAGVFADKNGQSVSIDDGVLFDENEAHTGYVIQSSVLYRDLEQRKRERVAWLPPQDTCNLETVRLIHLDGSALDRVEYDRMQRFLRLWRKLGWTIDEVDQALIGLGTGRVAENDVIAEPSRPAQSGRPVGFDVFQDDCASTRGSSGNRGDDDGVKCPKFLADDAEITAAFLHQLPSVVRLLERTGLSLSKLLTFWNDISTAGEKSLYDQIFLTHNLTAMDDVLDEDPQGNVLTESTKVSRHLPVLMAALKLKADDITQLLAYLGLPDELTLSTVSALFRHSLLLKLLRVKVSALSDVRALFGDPFRSAQDALTLLETWSQMEDAGFTFPKLAFALLGHDDPIRPQAPSKRAVLALTKQLCDGLASIDKDHPDLPSDSDEGITADLVRAKAGLIFDPADVERIVGLLEGTTVYATNAPSGLSITVPEELARKLKYSSQGTAGTPSAGIQLVGILTDTELQQAKGLSGSAGWAQALERAGKQSSRFFSDALFGVFASQLAEAKAVLLGGDANDPKDPAAPMNTALAKRRFFLQAYLPFLRQRLAHRLIVSCVASSMGLDATLTGELLTTVLRAGSPAKSAMEVLRELRSAAAAANLSGWRGYLIPGADEDYTFVVTSDMQPDGFMLAGQTVALPHQQEDPSNVWFSDPVPLKAGTLNELVLTGRPVAELQWKTATSPRAAIPGSILLPACASETISVIFTKLARAAIVLNGFGLTTEEMVYFQKHAADFDGFDLDNPSMAHWLRLQAYSALRNSLPKLERRLIDLFGWCCAPDDPTRLAERIAASTGWDPARIDKLAVAQHFNLNSPVAFRNEKSLVKLQRALAVADKTAIDIDRLFQWAKPGSKFWPSHQIAEDIRKAIRARYDQSDWEQVVKPLTDRLREDQKQALISYLVARPDLVGRDVVDADSLFEFFLIDVQMGTCMETSRIKQAISSVQLFIQRCLLGLESPNVESSHLDRARWDKWMQRYRVWEANRKVFLYPENWIVPELRDDKGPFFMELESELLQKDLNPKVIEDCIKNYLFKVDEVANLKVIGLHVEHGKDTAGNAVETKLHVFARTRNAPHAFFYRYYDFGQNQRNWYPWERMQVDIPSYDVEGAEGDKSPDGKEDLAGKVKSHGTYIAPTVVDGRLLVFFPQFVKKTRPAVIKCNGNAATLEQIGKSPFPNPGTSEYWEIRLAFTEYRNRKWTQKQLSKDAVYDEEPATSTKEEGKEVDGVGKFTLERCVAPSIDGYQFVPRNLDKPGEVQVQVYRSNVILHKVFLFQRSQVTAVVFIPFTQGTMPSLPGDMTFHYDGSKITSLQVSVSEPVLDSIHSFTDTESKVTVSGAGSSSSFTHTFADELVAKATSLEGVTQYYLGLRNEASIVQADAFGADGSGLYDELKRPFALYNWEAAFHAPMLLVDRLLKSQQYEQALNVCHCVLNPFAEGQDRTRFWQFLPFRKVNPERVLERLFNGLKPGASDPGITEWRDNPFNPHLVARGRPAAYMKWVAVKYVEILVAWGDYLFRQDTIETINQATQLYILASHVFGPRGQKIPKRGRVEAETYCSLLDKWDAFGNAMVDLELAFPFSNQPTIDPKTGIDPSPGLVNIFGSASALYFCIPDNPQLNALRETVEDRLFKVRHCESIEGVFRKLPLFEPPIDPALLVQAAAQGLSLASVLNDLNSPLPNYRFYYLLQKALEMCSELKSLGGAFLSVKEKADGEAISRLRAAHESAIHQLVMEVRKKQLEESERSLDALRKSRLVPVYRMQHALQLIGEELNKVPDEATDFSELAFQIEKPVDEGGLKLIAYEKEEMDKASEAAKQQDLVGGVEMLASELHAGPTFSFDAKLFGVGTGSSWGFPNLGSAASAIARRLGIRANVLTHESTSAARKASFLRQLQDRVQQANTAGYEIKNIDKQILTQQIRIAIAQQEIDNQQKQIDNSLEMEEFLRNKYTNQELYSWMEGELRALYHQGYTLAYDLAKRAEKAFRFERGLSTSSFIQPGYWDAGRDGLLAGERLHLALKQLEVAYQEQRGHDFEITKAVSLRQLAPFALLEFKETGSCEFALPEVLFDMDFPGHYARRIKAVSISVPCVVGPYVGLNCTARLIEHKYRISSFAKDKSDYPERIDVVDERFQTVNVPIAAIAASTAQNDSGTFELNFHDERYLPFEGAGVVSKWRLELPNEFRQFDYDTITDAILHLRYTSLDGGDKLKKAASESVNQFIKAIEAESRDAGLFAAFDIIHDFSNEWYRSNGTAAATRTLSLGNVNDCLPSFTKGRPVSKVLATDIYVLTSPGLASGTLKLSANGVEVGFADAPPIGAMKACVAKDAEAQLVGWQLTFDAPATPLDKFWMVVRYTLR